MALGGGVPPWLNVGPTDYLHAIQAGTNTGLQVAEAQNRAQAAIAARVLAQQKQAQDAWEFGERMRLAAEQHAQQGEYQSGMLDWHRQQLENDAQKAAMGDQLARDRLEETISHNTAMESISADRAQNLLDKGEASIVEHPEVPGVLFLRNPSGAESVVERPDKAMKEGERDRFILSASRAMSPIGTESPTDASYQARTNIVGPLLEKYRRGPAPALDLSQPLPTSDIQGIGGLPPMVPLSINPSPAASTSNAARRAAAEAAIAAGAPREAVARRFKDLTGEDF